MLFPRISRCQRSEGKTSKLLKKSSSSLVKVTALISLSSNVPGELEIRVILVRGCYNTIYCSLCNVFNCTQ